LRPLSLFEIIDLYELPFESALTLGGSSHLLAGLTSSLLAAGYLGLFALMVLESMALPIPSEVFIPMAGYLVFAGKMSFGIALTVITVGGLVGSLIIFYLALILGRPVVYSLARKIGINESSLIKLEKWLSGKGSIAVFIARFVPGIRSSISIPAGALKMNLTRFSIVTVLGTLGWSFLLMYAGYMLGPVKFGSGTSSALLDQLILYVVAIVSVSYAIYFLVHKFRVKESNIASRVEPLNK
jgi:membrane protein DedA with SNARE-associated domain